jgi:hypothetical protein
MEEARVVITHIAKKNNRPVPDLSSMEKVAAERTDKKHSRRTYAKSQSILFIFHKIFVFLPVQKGDFLNVQALS